MSLLSTVILAVSTHVWVPLVIVGVVLLIILANIKVVSQSNQFVTEMLGRYRSTWSAGLHIKTPFIEKIVRRVSLKEQILDSPPQPVITRDNVTMQIDAVVYYRIFDAKLYTYGVVDPRLALENLTATTLRNIVGELDLDSTLTSRDIINEKMALILDKATDPWGIKVSRVEIKNIIPPREIQMSMEKQMKAERDRRETLLQADGHKQAVITRAEGDKQAMLLEAEGERDAKIARAEGEARAKILERQAEAEGLRLLKEANIDNAVLELKRYEALIKLADGRAAKIIVPSNVVDMAQKNVVFSEVTGLGKDTTAPIPAEDVQAPEEDPCCDRFKDAEAK